MMGFILHSTKKKNIRIHWALNLFLWMICLVLACCLVYGNYNLAEYPAVEVSNFIKIISDLGHHFQREMYAVLVKALWGFCLAWVTFACVKV